MCANQREINDRNHLLNILPEEVWLLVFDKITNHNDQEMFSNSSLFLRQMLLSQRTKFMFKNVWEILGKKYEKYIGIGESVYRQSATFNYFNDQLDPRDDGILGLSFTKRVLVSLLHRIRMVCKSWNNAVSSFYQHHPLHFLLQTEDPSTFVENLTCSMIQDGFQERRPANVDSFLSHFSQSHHSTKENPFFGKNVVIAFRDTDTENGREFRKKICHILEKHGHHIFYCAIKVHDVRPNTVRYYWQIRTFLEMMPNLKVLRLYFQPHWSCRIENLSPDVLEWLQTEISARPLPTFEGLKMLSTCNVPTPVFQELIRGNSQITTLDIVRLENQSDYNIYTVPLPNLTTLSINYHSQEDFERLANPQVKWALTKLCLDIDPNEVMEWNVNIFAMLEEKWADSLVELVINLPKAKELEHKKRFYQEIGALQLNLPRLKSLKLTMRNLTCLDFLLALKDSLLELQIKVIVYGEVNDGVTDVDELERGNIIKLLSCASRPVESNIYDLFPHLERACFSQYIKRWGTSLDEYLIQEEEWTLERRGRAN